MDDIRLARLRDPAPRDRFVEVVERKGKGHPDTICDALAEEASKALTRHYRERIGFPLHHNVDKTLLWAGASEPAFGGGEVTQPMRIFLAGRATTEMEGATFPVSELAVEAAREWLSASLHCLDPVRHVEIIPLFRPGSRELVELFRRQHETGHVLANDTSCGVGFAPFSDLERVVLAAERALTAVDIARDHPAIGEDVKVMGVRLGEQIELTLGCAIIGRYVPDLVTYGEIKERVAAMALDAAERVTDKPVRVLVNTADDPDAGSVYLTVTGTSAEAGDDGQAGRGNRVSGLITPYRPMVLESAPGKNPVSHPGKVYAVAAQLLAQDLAAEVDGITEAHCLLLSRIGAPIDRPPLVEVRIRTRDDVELERLRPQVEAVVTARLETLRDLWRELIAGRASALTSTP